jgi:DNA-binding HxlR family transcriptional regulator
MPRPKQYPSLISLISGKWTIPIIGVLRQGTLRYSAIGKAVPDITQRALTLTLRNLERSGMVARKVCLTIPPQVDYKLTPLGLELLEVTETIAEWAEKHSKEIKRAQKVYDKLIEE